MLVLTKDIPPSQENRYSVLFLHYGKSICFAETTSGFETGGCSCYQSEQLECGLRESYGSKRDNDRLHNLFFGGRADSWTCGKHPEAGDKGDCNAPNNGCDGTLRCSAAGAENAHGKTCRNAKEDEQWPVKTTSFGYVLTYLTTASRFTSIRGSSTRLSIPSTKFRLRRSIFTKSLSILIMLAGAWTLLLGMKRVSLKGSLRPSRIVSLCPFFMRV